MLYYSIAKGILYVLVTSILIYALIYPTLKEALDGKEALSKANAQLQKTNELYKKLKARLALDRPEQLSLSVIVGNVNKKLGEEMGLSLVDAYDTMTQDRAYRKAMPVDVAVQEILKHIGTQFDPTIADIFVKKFWVSPKNLK